MSDTQTPVENPNVTLVQPAESQTTQPASIDDIIGAPEIVKESAAPAETVETPNPVQNISEVVTAAIQTGSVTPVTAPTLPAEPPADDLPPIEDPQPKPVNETPATPVAPDVEETAAVLPPTVQQKAKQEFAYVYTLPEDSTGDEDSVSLPSAFPEQVQAVFTNAKNQDYQDNPSGRMWWGSLEASMRMGPYKSLYKKTVEDPNAEFRQGVEFNGSRLMGGSPRFKQIQGEALTGEKAVLRLRKQAGIGVPFSVPLWHSGFWLTLKAPTDTELINLNYLITTDKIDFGRYTYGLSLSNSLAYTIRRLMDFAMDHVYDCSLDLKNVPGSGLMSLIHQQDIQTIVWGIVCSMYPNNFKFDRPCINNPETCNYVEHSMINPRVLQWTNKTALNNWQLNHMSKRGSGSMSLEDVRRYQGELRQNQKRTFVLTEGDKNNDPIKLTLKPTTVADHMDAGFRWISEITDAVERVIQEDSDTKDRNALINQYAQATLMRQYTHLVDSIDPGNNNIIQDPETIERALSEFSADSRVRDTFITECVKYIEESTITVIGLTAFDCPKCGADQGGKKDSPEFSNVIPLDLINLFFNLFGQRVAKISQR